MADYGIAVKKALYNGAPVNKNVDQCADYELAYSSKFSISKQQTAQADVFTLTSTNSAAPSTYTITHNLGYIPWAVVAMEQAPLADAYFLLDGSKNDGAPATFYVTTTTLTIVQTNFTLGALGNYRIFVYIFYDELA